MKRFITITALLVGALLCWQAADLAAFNISQNGNSNQVGFGIDEDTGLFTRFFTGVIKKDPPGTRGIQKKHARYVKSIDIPDTVDSSIIVLRKAPPGVQVIQKKGPVKTR